MTLFLKFTANILVDLMMALFLGMQFYAIHFGWLSMQRPVLNLVLQAVMKGFMGSRTLGLLEPMYHRLCWCVGLSLLVVGS